MHDDLFTKHILDYLQRIIYNQSTTNLQPIQGDLDGLTN